MAKGSKSRGRGHRPALSRHGELTLADVDWLGERSCLPQRVIETLTELVENREDGQSAESESVARPSTDDTIEVRATTAAVALAKAKDIRLADVEATGHVGSDGSPRIIVADVRRAVAERSASA